METTMTDQEIKPLPRTQARMAGLIERERVAYNPDTATWYLGSGDHDVAVKGDGRALREMRVGGLLVVKTSEDADERGAYPVRLTELGEARHRA